MKTFSIFGIVAISVLLISGCTDESESIQAKSESVESTSVTNNQDTDEHKHEQSFIPDYVYAADLNEELNNQQAPFIFDVRSVASFEKSHVSSAISVPYGTIDENLLSRVENLSADSAIVTYCGCPRHLSTLATKDLLDLGYQNVSVLYEGFWHWKDSGFPTFEAADNNQAITTLRFDGKLARSQNIQGNTEGDLQEEVDIFLRHQKTGQLEAVRTQSDGRFFVDFHLYDFNKNDNFEIIVKDLENNPKLIARSAYPETTHINITL